MVILTSCKWKKEPPCQGNYTYKQVRQFLRDYFPYTAGQKIKFLKYIDSTYVTEVTFSADSSIFYKKSSITSGSNDDPCNYVDTIEHYKMKITNLTEFGKDFTIEIIGNYFPNKYINDQDLSKLEIKYGIDDFSFSSFGNAVKNGYYKYEINDYIWNGANIGKVFCLYPKRGKRIYFNSEFGILKFANDSTKEELILAP